MRCKGRAAAACWPGETLAVPTFCRPSSPHGLGAGMAPRVILPHTLIMGTSLCSHAHLHSCCSTLPMHVTLLAPLAQAPVQCPRGSRSAHIQPPGLLTSLWTVLSPLPHASYPWALSSVRLWTHTGPHAHSCVAGTGGKDRKSEGYTLSRKALQKITTRKKSFNS